MRSTIFTRLFDSMRGALSRGGRKSRSRDSLLHGMVRGIVSTHEDEIACDECFDLLDRYAELVLEGKDPTAELASVQDHLDRCACCREEYEVLMESLRSLQ